MSTGPTFELTGGGVLVAVGLLVGGVLAYQAYAGATAGINGLVDTVKGWVTPFTPEERQAAYDQSLSAAQASAAESPWTSWITHNPNNYPLSDLTPAGYEINQYGDVVKKPGPYTSGNGGSFTGT